MKRTWVVAFNCITFVWAQTWSIAAFAGAFEEGQAAGRAAVPVARGAATLDGASSVVPGYTTTPPQIQYKGQKALGAAAAAQLAACAATPDDVSCQAELTAVKSANTPRPGVGAYDPAVRAARDIAANPSLTLGSISAYYAGCVTADVPRAAGTATKVCNRYSGLGRYACQRDLSVEVTKQQTCVPGTWYVSDTFHRPGYERWADQMNVQALCEPDRTDGRVHFRANAFGSDGACTGWIDFEIDMFTPTADAGMTNRVATLLPDWSSQGCSYVLDVYQVGPGCVGDTCTKTFHYVRSPGDRSRVVEEYWRTLTFPRPGYVEKDTWMNNCPVLAAGGRCSVVGAERCVDGPGDKQVGGRPVSRTCWAYETTMNCDGGAAPDECAPLADAGCTLNASACKQADPATQQCQVFQDTYACPQAASTATTASNCPASQFCLGSNCFNTASVADPDFGRSMTMLESAREAGVYLDTSKMTVFNGEDNRCGNHALKDCCTTDGAGKGMTNQSMFGVGSGLVYDVLMNSENREFITQGVQALMASSGFTGSFTSYGVTVAVNGTALPAGSVVLSAGDTVVVAFDPWSLAIAVVIYVVLSALSCDKDEVQLSMKRGAGLCHEIGSYCSKRILGSCLTRKHTHCCFNSVLARIVNEQGRAQIGKGWGGAKAPDCTGFTIDQLQALDFAAMDFREVYASISPKLLDPAAAGASNAAKVPACYYGQGRC